MKHDHHLALKVGDLVQLRDPRAIIATLDPTGAFEAVPFMPENMKYFGKQFRVLKKVERICDTIDLCAMARRMKGTVYLDDLRCDGSGHDGCGARCRIFWKEEWLEKIDSDQTVLRPLDPDALAELDRIATRNACRLNAAGEKIYFCQATEANRASEQQPPWILSQYARELLNRNISLGEFITTACRAVYFKSLRTFRKSGLLPLELPVPNRKDRISKPLQPGDWVQVRSFEEIAQTLNSGAKNRGLSFGHEMLPAIGKTFRILDRVERIVDEKNGRMTELKNDCYILDNFYCLGDRSPGRWFCPKGVYAFWRGAWLKRIASPPQKKSEPISQRLQETA